MTKEEAKELLPIIQAYADGRTILIKHDGDWFESCENTEIFFSESPSDYRIKPEPKCRPFKSQEECWNEMHKHPDFGWLYYKEKGYYININAIGDRVGMNGQKFVEAFSDYTFTDRIPFGIKEE